jgi:hypothetical protein
VADVGPLHSARVVYEGNLTGKFAEDVRIGMHGVAEGIVCKGGSGSRDPWMAKIKTDAYQEQLKKAFGVRTGSRSVLYLPAISLLLLPWATGPATR